MTILLWIALVVWIVAGLFLGYIMGFSKSSGVSIVLVNNGFCLLFVIIGMTFKYYFGE